MIWFKDEEKGFKVENDGEGNLEYSNLRKIGYEYLGSCSNDNNQGKFSCTLI